MSRLPTIAVAPAPREERRASAARRARPARERSERERASTGEASKEPRAGTTGARRGPDDETPATLP